ncbi:MFS transporter [Proteiniclasticum sp. C24MP]|uniref:MFS transporter n=1 Tax=Proteiniclasticum sp. C24MP TaxID=3374101 RepID=UPI0037553A2C
MKNNISVTTKLTARYALIHGAYWMVFGATYNFITVYLLSKNFESHQIGLILAFTNIFSAILQPLVAGYADRSRKSALRYTTSLMLFICLSLSFIMAVSPAIMFITASLYFMLLTVMLTIHPLINSLGMNYINEGIPLNFGFARGMGSLAYAAMSYVLGAAVEQYGTDILPYAFILLFSFTFVFTISFRLKNPTEAADSFQTDRKEPIQSSPLNSSTLSASGFILKYHRFSLYLLGVILIFISFNIINIYMIKIVQNVGGNEATMGSAFAIAAVLELPVMLSFTKIINKYHNASLLKLAGLFFTAKAFITLVSSTIGMIYLAQSFQMLSYAIFIPGSIYYVNQVIDKKDMIKGQAFTTAATTLGGVGGSLIGGWILSVATVRLMLVIGLVFSLAGSVILLLTIEK